MSLFKRGNVWWVRFTAPNGDRIRRSAGTCDKQAAQEYHDRIKSDAWRVYRLGEKPNRTWEDAVVQWFKEKGHKATIERDRDVLRWCDRFLRSKSLIAIDRELLWKMAETKRRETSPANANRTMAIVRAILRRARDEWEWLDKAPKVPMYPEQSKRIRWITRDEAEVLMAYLPPHQAAMVRFSLATGLRQSNVTGLRWENVDMPRRCCWIHADQAKARKPIAVPLNAEAVAVLTGLIGQHEHCVFSYKGKAITQTNTKAWRAALIKAGIEDFRWHDLRHTWASWHVQAGTPLHALQEMGGWSTADMVRRYAHLSASHLADHAERIVPVVGPNTGTTPDRRVVGLR